MPGAFPIESIDPGCCCLLDTFMYMGVFLRLLCVSSVFLLCCLRCARPGGNVSEIDIQAGFSDVKRACGGGGGVKKKVGYLVAGRQSLNLWVCMFDESAGVKLVPFALLRAALFAPPSPLVLAFI